MSYWLCINILYLLILNIILQFEYSNVQNMISLCLLGIIIIIQIISKLWKPLQQLLSRSYFGILQEIVFSIISASLESLQRKDNFQGETLFQVNFICLHSFLKMIKMHNLLQNREEILRQLYCQILYLFFSFIFYGIILSINNKISSVRQIITFTFYSLLNFCLLFYTIILEKKLINKDNHLKKLENFKTQELVRKQTLNNNSKTKQKRRTSGVDTNCNNIYDFYMSKQKQFKLNSSQMKIEKKQIDNLFPILINLSSNGIILIEKVKCHNQFQLEGNQELKIKFMNKFIQNIFGVMNEDELMKYLMTQQDLIEEDYIDENKNIKRNTQDCQFKFNGQKINAIKRGSQQICTVKSDSLYKQNIFENSSQFNLNGQLPTPYKDSPAFDQKPKNFDVKIF